MARMKKETKKPQIVIYQALGDEQKIRVRIEDDNVWLTQKLIAELFDVDVRTVNEHLKNIFESGELVENSVIRNFRITATDGFDQEVRKLLKAEPARKKSKRRQKQK